MEFIKEYWYIFAIAAFVLIAGIVIAAVLSLRRVGKPKEVAAPQSPIAQAHTLLTEDTLEIPHSGTSVFSIDREITFVQSDQVI